MSIVAATGAAAAVITPRDLFFDQLCRSRERVLLLDYDGTIAPFSANRHRALPYSTVPELLDCIMSTCHTRVALITGRAAREIPPLLGLNPHPESVEDGLPTHDPVAILGQPDQAGLHGHDLEGTVPGGGKSQDDDGWNRENGLDRNPRSGSSTRRRCARGSRSCGACFRPRERSWRSGGSTEPRTRSP